VVDVVLEILDELGVRVVCYDNSPGALERTYQAGKARAGAELENRFVLD
jgi:hypothetical protein